MKIYSIGNRGPNADVHDIVYHIEVKRKYLYIFREEKQKIWNTVAKVPKAYISDPEQLTYSKVEALYFLFGFYGKS